jgi:hypothetical protein
MSVELLLFFLRVISGLALLALLVLIFAALWRDYRGTLAQMEAGRRVYGHLVALQEVNGSYLPTGVHYPLLSLTSLGRSPTNTITLNDTFASSEHAMIILRNGQWWLEDRQSRNGTLLNDTPITQPIVIADGDIVGIGTVRLQLVLES